MLLHKLNIITISFTRYRRFLPICYTPFSISYFSRSATSAILVLHGFCCPTLTQELSSHYSLFFQKYSPIVSQSCSFYLYWHFFMGLMFLFCWQVIYKVIFLILAEIAFLVLYFVSYRVVAWEGMVVRAWVTKMRFNFPFNGVLIIFWYTH